MSEINYFDIECLLFKIERIVNRDGWDEPPRLMVVYQNGDTQTERNYRGVLEQFGKPIKCGEYSAMQMCSPSDMEGIASHIIFDMALRFMASSEGTADYTTEYILNTLRNPGFIGIILCCESWTSRISPEERNGRMLADIPGSLETRIISYGDVNGKSKSVSRARGEKPQLLDDMTGCIPESLICVSAVVAKLPPPEIRNLPSRWRQ